MSGKAARAQSSLAPSELLPSFAHITSCWSSPSHLLPVWIYAEVETWLSGLEAPWAWPSCRQRFTAPNWLAKSICSNDCQLVCQRVFKTCNTWLFSQGHWPLFLYIVNSQDNSSHLVWVNQNYTFFCQIGKKYILCVCCTIWVIILCVPWDKNGWKSLICRKDSSCRLGC